MGMNKSIPSKSTKFYHSFAQTTRIDHKEHSLKRKRVLPVVSTYIHTYSSIYILISVENEKGKWSQLTCYAKVVSIAAAASNPMEKRKENGQDFVCNGRYGLINCTREKSTILHCSFNFNNQLLVRT